MTSTEAARSIRSEGFREGSGESNGAIWGPGVYLAGDVETVALYSAADTETMEVTVHLERPLFYEVPERTTRDMESIVMAAAEQHAGPLPAAVQPHLDRRSQASWASHAPDFSGAAFDRWHELINERMPSRADQRAMTGRSIEATRVRSRELALRDVVREYGYDGIVLCDPAMSRQGAGGNQIVVFNPQAVST